MDHKVLARDHLSLSGGSQDGTLDIWRYLQIFYIHRWLFLLVFFSAIILGWVYYLTSAREDRYHTDVELFYVHMITTADQGFSPVYSGGSVSSFDGNFWLSLMRSLEARRLTAENSRLALGKKDDQWGYKIDIKPEERGRKSFSDGAPVFLLTVYSVNQDHVSRLVWGFVESMNQLLAKYQIEGSRTMVDYIRGQIEDNNHKLSAIDRNIMESHSGNPFLEKDITTMLSDIEAFRKSLLDARIDLASVQASRERTEQELSPLDGIIISESAFSEPLKVQLMNLHVDLARARTRNTENHPSVIAIRNNIEQINNMLRDTVAQRMEIRSEAIDPVKQVLTQRYLDLSIKEISLQARIRSLEEVIHDIEYKIRPDTSSIRYQQLTRNREMVLITINQLNNKLIETQSAARAGINRFMIIDEPPPPTSQSDGDLLVFIAIALFLGLAAGGAVVVLYDFIDNRIMLIRDYERLYSFPVLGVIPFRKKESILGIFEKTDKNENWRQDEFANLTVSVLQILKKKNTKTLAVCSPVRNEGKSTTALKLARYLSENSNMVLLVDFDMFDPGITRELDNRIPGLLDYIGGQCTEKDLIKKTAYHNLFFVSSGKTAGIEPHVNYTSPSILTFIQWAEEHFDTIIIDTPASLYIPDIAFLMERMGAVLPVIRLRYSTRRAIDSMLKLFKSSNRKKIIGVVIRDMRYFRLGKYGYYYPYSYKYKYDQDE